ncbi:MAG: DUF3800 domain-containing protein [Beduini sp.]|uniref:DUF3800 domain-containing protein n=1 Tax=Beduini sp. TaxID=1922300 RepID=UPI00399FC504
MKIWVYIDESGSIHKNSNTNYFAIGGYFAYGDEFAHTRIMNKYKKINKKHKKNRKMSMSEELKTRNMTLNEKLELITHIQKIDNFIGCAILFDKSHMRKQIAQSNIFFNYGVKILFKDTILPLLPEDETYEFILSIDNRNISVGQLNDLEKFLNTEFCYFDYSFSIKYYDSASHYGIQLADLIVNTMYMRSKDRSFVEPILNTLDTSKFRLNIFPGKIYCGRATKLSMEKSSELTKVG